MGYKGAYIAGIDKHDDLGTILEKAKEFESANWHDFIPELTNPRPKEFYFMIWTRKPIFRYKQKKQPSCNYKDRIIRNMFLFPTVSIVWFMQFHLSDLLLFRHTQDIL